LAHPVPHRGDPTSSSFISESRPGDFLHAPSCGLASNRPSPHLIRGGGISPCLIIWRSTCPDWVSPPNGDPGSTHILTRHYGAQSQSVGQLASSGMMPTRNTPQLSPSGLTKHPTGTHTYLAVCTLVRNPSHRHLMLQLDQEYTPKCHDDSAMG
jgi:hypothetical protein